MVREVRSPGVLVKGPEGWRWDVGIVSVYHEMTEKIELQSYGICFDASLCMLIARLVWNMSNTCTILERPTVEAIVPQALEAGIM